MTTTRAASFYPFASLLLAAALTAGCAERQPVAPPDGGPSPADLPLGNDDYAGVGGDLYAPPVWTCGPSKLGILTCLRKRAQGGLPRTGQDWQCHLGTAGTADASTWFCHGRSDSDPSGSGWWCEPFTPLPAPKRWRCKKPDSAEDRPPTPGPWVCVKGDPFGGTRCQRQPQPQIPPLLQGGACVPGQRQWCDDTTYDGWGTVDCDPSTGRWKTRMVNGKQVIDCHAHGQALPLTLCAQYHFFFNPACCERQDCIVPEGTAGQPYAKSSGGRCAFCNPQMPECTAAGAKCLVTNASETFCGQLCTADADCAGGAEASTCMKVKLKVGTTMQCVPADFSCYY